jgi:hypothetical protein
MVVRQLFPAAMRAALGLGMTARRFPPPWSFEGTEACFIVRDAQLSPTSISTRDEAWLPRDRKDRLRGGAI